MNSDPTNLKRAIRKVKLFFAAMAIVLVGVKAGRVSAALEIVRGDEGKKLMDSIRDTIAEINSQQERCRVSAMQSSSRISKGVSRF
jgi:CHASE3 domain sensor protein